MTEKQFDLYSKVVGTIGGLYALAIAVTEDDIGKTLRQIIVMCIIAVLLYFGMKYIVIEDLFSLNSKPAQLNNPLLG